MPVLKPAWLQWAEIKYQRPFDGKNAFGKSDAPSSGGGDFFIPGLRPDSIPNAIASLFFVFFFIISIL